MKISKLDNKIFFLLKYEVLKAKNVPDIQKKYNLRDNQYLHYFIRARYGNDSLICISYTYINQDILPNMDLQALEGSLTEYIIEKGIVRTNGKSLPLRFLISIILNILIINYTEIWPSLSLSSSSIFVTTPFSISQRGTMPWK